MSHLHSKGPGIWRKRATLRRQVLERDGHRCRSCGRAGKLEVDHVTPLFKGGSEWSPNNLQSLCRGCHIDKSRAERVTPDPARDAWRKLVSERMKSNRRKV